MIWNLTENIWTPRRDSRDKGYDGWCPGENKFPYRDEWRSCAAMTATFVNSRVWCAFPFDIIVLLSAFEFYSFYFFALLWRWKSKSILQFGCAKAPTVRECVVVNFCCIRFEFESHKQTINASFCFARELQKPYTYVTAYLLNLKTYRVRTQTKTVGLLML
jgi:hypothetical protein